MAESFWPWLVGAVVVGGAAALIARPSSAAGTAGATGGSLTGGARMTGGSGGTVVPSWAREGASVILARTEHASQAAREREFLAALLGGNVPSWQSGRVRVPLAANGHTGAVWVMPDVLSVGTDEDFVRVPLTPQGAQLALDALGMALPTPKITDAIYAVARAAGHAIQFRPWAPRGSLGRGSNTALREHHAAIEVDRAALGGFHGLIDGHAKSVVIDPLIARNPGKVIIYGGRYRDGSLVQPLFAGHSDDYLDYSHGVRGVARVVEVDGAQRDYFDVLRDPAVAPLFASGPIVNPRYV